MLRSTFLGYRTATSALIVSQNQMDVVGQNMSNIETKGYTRQRLDVSSLSFDTSNFKFGANGVVIGQGAEATGISQYRDSFLDLRYRIESAKVGEEEVELNALSDLESVMDEISMDKLETQFSELTNKLQSLTSSPSDPVLEGVVRTSASMLCQMFNDYSKNINKINEQQQSYLKNEAVIEVDQLMKNIADLNVQIRENNISGNPALELNDSRNMLIDKLSTYLDIEVTQTPVSIGAGKTIDELSIKLKGSGGTNVMLVGGKEYAEISSSGTDIVLSKTIDATATGTDLTSVIDGGKISAYLDFVNGKGEFAVAAGENSYRGVQYYGSMLDTLANKFATLMNEANTVDPATPKLLFESRGGGEITAGNIKISDAWMNATESYITNTKSTETTDTTGATDNILKMISLFKEKHDFNYSYDDGSGTLIDKPLFKGNMQEFLTYSITTLNLQVGDAENSYDTYTETQAQIDLARRSLSSIDLNEEGVNLLTYSKSYNAAARLMTTLDEMLDTLINRMAV